MGDSNSKQAQDNRTTQQQREREEHERKQKAEQLKRAKELEDKQRLDAKEVQLTSLKYTHEEEVQKLTELEKCNERRDLLAEKERQLEHERLMHSQGQLFAIVQETFSNVKAANINEAAYGAYILQCIQSKQPIDFKVLELVASKVDNSPPINLGQIVDKVIEKVNIEDGLQMEEDVCADGYQDRRVGKEKRED